MTMKIQILTKTFTKTVGDCSLLRGAMVVSKCQVMNKKKVENHACLVGHYRHYRLYRCISRTTTWRGINKIPKCFSCPGDCKELSKKTKRSTYDSNQARTKPWPTRPPTSDNNSPITKRIRTNETQNVRARLCTYSGERLHCSSACGM